MLNADCGGVNSTSITLLAPTNDGIRRSLAATDPPSTLQTFQRNSNVVLQVLMYHVLPTPLPVRLSAFCSNVAHLKDWCSLGSCCPALNFSRHTSYVDF